MTAPATSQVVDVRNGERASRGWTPTTWSKSRRGSIATARTRFPSRRCSAEMLELVHAAKAYERLAIRAAESGDRETPAQALEANPLVGPRIGDVDAAARRAARGQSASTCRASSRADAHRRAPRSPSDPDAARDRADPGRGRPRARRGAATTCGRSPPRCARARPRCAHDRRPRHVGPRRGLRPVPDRDRTSACPTGLAKPSVTTIYGAPLRWRGGLLLAISQSGQSPDIVAVVAAAREGGRADGRDHQRHPFTAGRGRRAQPPLPRRARAGGAGHEDVRRRAGGGGGAGRGDRAVDATSRTAWPACPARCAPRCAHRSLARRRRRESAPGPTAVAAFARANRALVVSRGYNLATALELALKFKETCGLFAEAYSTADFAHGPVVLAQPRVPVAGHPAGWTDGRAGRRDAACRPARAADRRWSSVAARRRGRAGRAGAALRPAGGPDADRLRRTRAAAGRGDRPAARDQPGCADRASAR